MRTSDQQALEHFLHGKSVHTITLFHHLVAEFENAGTIMLHPAKTMIGIGNPEKRVAWVTQLGKNFVHVVFPFDQPYEDNLCFMKIAQVPGAGRQFNHHFRMLETNDVNDEVRSFINLALKG